MAVYFANWSHDCITLNWMSKNTSNKIYRQIIFYREDSKVLKEIFNFRTAFFKSVLGEINFKIRVRALPHASRLFQITIFGTGSMQIISPKKTYINSL